MKKEIVLIIMISFLTISSVYSFGKKEGRNSSDQPPINAELPGEVRKSTSEEAEITGLVERGFENRISIVINPRSKSRVSYYPDEKASKKLEKKLGQTVTVTGIVKNTENPFKKEIEISEIK